MEPWAATTPPRTVLGRLLRWRGLLMLACVVLVYAPLLWAHGLVLWARSHYQFFPVAILAALLLAGQRLRGVAALTAGPRMASFAWLGLAILFLVGANLLQSPWLGALSFLILLAGLLIDVGGWRLFVLGLPAWIALWLVIPPPLGLDSRLILLWQSLTSQWSSRILDVFGVFHIRSGHVFEIRGRQLFVDDACAGINSLFFIFTCTLLYGLWARRPLVRSVLLMVAAVGWVLAANVAHVVVTVGVLTRYGVDLTRGWQHVAVGLVLFGGVLVLIWSTDRLLWFFVSVKTSSPAPPAAAALDDGAWNGRTGWAGSNRNSPARRSMP